MIDVYGNIDLLAPHHWAFVPPHQVDWSDYEAEFPLATILEEIRARDPARAITHAPFFWEIHNVPESTTQARWAAPAFRYSTRVQLQTAVKEYLSRSKTNAQVLCRLDELPENERRGEAAKWSLLHLIDGRTDYPPTAFLHGSGDAQVPIQFSRDMASKLREVGVPVLESYEEGAPHAFDQIYTVRRLGRRG